MTIDIVVRDEGKAIIPLEELDSSTLHWLRGDPGSPEKNLLLLYQEKKIVNMLIMVS